MDDENYILNLIIQVFFSFILFILQSRVEDTAGHLYHPRVILSENPTIEQLDGALSARVIT